jgi:hypothetical protein
MKDFLMLVIKIHLILSFSLIIELFFVGIKKFGFRRFFRELKDDNFWYVIVVFLTSPYEVILIGVGQVGKKTAEIIDKIKHIVMEKEELEDE